MGFKNIRLSDQLHLKLKVAASEAGMTMTKFINLMIENQGESARRLTEKEAAIENAEFLLRYIKKQND